MSERQIKFRFDRHGLGDCAHFAHAVQLYLRRGYDVTVAVEENKIFLWRVSGVNVIQDGSILENDYGYPHAFDDLHAPDCEQNKVAFGLRNSVMPPLSDLGLSVEQAWDELCAVRLSAHDHISPQAHAEAEQFLEGMPRPIVCLHSRGTNWHERKSIPTEVAFETILKLLEQTSGSIIVLDWDRRAPSVCDSRVKGIMPSWGQISPDRLCALYERSDLMIGIDSGPFHVAAMTNVKALGVFRSLHPNRVCLPNPNAVYLASDIYASQYDRRRPLWNITTYSGAEPTADLICQTALSLLAGKITYVSKKESTMLQQQLAGRYLYRRVGHDERMLRLEPDGRISDGSEGCEQRWMARKVDGVDAIEISGKHGVICTCKRVGDRFKGAWTQFERMPIELIPFGLPESEPNAALPKIEGEYFCEFIGETEFPITLCDDGRATSPDNMIDSWRQQAGGLQLSKAGNRVVILQSSVDGVWRGAGPKNCLVEMIPSDRQPFRSFGATTPIKYRKNEYLYTSLEQFKVQCFDFARKLPPVKAIAGIPRSGLLAASLVSLELNCPMIPIESLLDGTIPKIPVPRRGRGPRFNDDGIILVIDDNSSSGRVIASLRPKIHPDVKIGVIVGNEHADIVGSPIDRQVFQSYEWTLLHDDNAEYTLVDMDGVLCEDWTGGSEIENQQAYLDFLTNARPRRIPSYPLLGIVTNRLEQHRPQTEEWLTRHGIHYGKLVMSPHETFVARDAAGDSASRKAAVYRDEPKCRLFIESSGRQAIEIQRLTGRPVLSIEDNEQV